MRTTILLFASALVAASCSSSSPTGPNGGASPAAALRIVGNPVIDFEAGESRALQIEARDSSGTLVSVPATSYMWATSDPAVATVSAAGVVTAGTGLGQAIITATSSTGESAPARIWVQLPPGEPSTYRIQLMYAEGVPESWKPYFQWAAERWQRVIRAKLPSAALVTPPSNVCGDTAGAPPLPTLSGTTEGTVILVERTPIGTNASGGPCTHRPWPAPTVIFGRVTIVTPSGNDAFSHLAALHEMGHALGLVAVIQGVQPPWFDVSTSRYTGPFALEGYRRHFGKTPAFLDTPGAHWTFADDVMGPSGIAVTPVTVGALMDMGYPAAWYGAGL